MSIQIIAQGAEAIIKKKGASIIKERVKKGYRHDQLDEKLRKLRTRQEAKLIEKVNQIIPSPKLIKISESSKTLEMEYLKGEKLASSLDSMKNKNKIGKIIGNSIAKIHDADIIHGDLTTSNMISKLNKVFFIDFGLGFHSSNIEDKAVDLHVLKEALEARHPKSYDIVWKAIEKGYNTSHNASQVLKQLEKVERRGRYKSQY